MKQTTFSDLERNNKTCMYAHLIDSSIMTLFCILQALSGLQTWGYIIIFAVLGFGPVIAEFFFWNKSHETPAIQHLVAIGFAVFYSFAIFTATNGLVFLFVIPMILIISVYNDAKYSLIINTGTVTKVSSLQLWGLRPESLATPTGQCRDPGCHHDHGRYLFLFYITDIKYQYGTENTACRGITVTVRKTAGKPL